jgi:hypothetical protein
MKAGIARIYYGGGRRWFTLRAACHAHARAVIKKRLRSQDFERGDEWPAERIKRLARRLEREHRRKTP